MCVKLMALDVFWLCILCSITIVASKNTDCGKLEDKSQLPWTVGIYLEKEDGHLELICLGTIVKDRYVLTAAQCVCESLSNAVRKEHIFVSRKFEKNLKKSSSTLSVKTKDIISRSDYKGFLLNPSADLAILKIEDQQKIGYPVCVDWSDLNFLLQGDKSGLFSLWIPNQLKTLNASFLDYDSCTLSTSGEFVGILGYDKNCFKVSTSDLVPESIGSGIYFQNPKDGKWYLEGIVSSQEVSKNEVFVAATSTRHYLSWISRICA